MFPRSAPSQSLASGVALALLLTVAGCLNDGPTATAAGARVDLAIRAQVVGGAGDHLGIAVSYARIEAAPTPRVLLLSRDVLVDTGTTRFAVSVDLGPCLEDPLRRPAADGSPCQLEVTLTLRDAGGVLIAESALPPVGGAPGGTTLLPEATLTAKTTAVALAASPGSLLPGGTLQLTAVVRDTNARILEGRTVQWTVTGADPGAVQLDATSSTTTAAGATVTLTAVRPGGPLTVTATAGERSATAHVVVNAPYFVTPTEALVEADSVYLALQALGVYGRWMGFASDIRSDIGFSPSPWADLAAFSRTVLANYDFEVNLQLWNDHYAAIERANRVIAWVPLITMDPALADRLVAEARFVRALMYFDLANLYGNVPLLLAPRGPVDRTPTSSEAQVRAQVEADLVAAHAVLPASYPAAEAFRPTRWAAAALLGKAILQQSYIAPRPAEAAAWLTEAAGGPFALMPNYGDNFTEQFEFNAESVFEVSFDATPGHGMSMPKMIGPCGPAYCDGQATRWFYDQFLLERTTQGLVDPRLDATLFYNKPGGMDVYGTPYTTRYGANATQLLFKKYGEYYGLPDQRWDSAINFRVIRYADVLLLLAEAENERGNVAGAAASLNRVRARAALAPLPTTLTQAEMRDRILHERLLELGLEGQRWLDLRRHALFSRIVPADAGSAACTPEPIVAGCDAEFSVFVPGMKDRLPIPASAIAANPNLVQNPGW